MNSSSKFSPQFVQSPKAPRDQPMAFLTSIRIYIVIPPKSPKARILKIAVTYRLTAGYTYSLVVERYKPLIIAWQRRLIYEFICLVLLLFPFILCQGA